MKNIYVCECCGKQFTDYSECWEHEQIHKNNLSGIYNWEMPCKEEDKEGIPSLFEWGEEDVVPSAIYMKVPCEDEHGNYRQNEYGDIVYDVYKFIRARSSKDVKQAERVAEGLTIRNREDYLAREEEEARRKAKEAEQDTAENTEEEN